MSQPGVPVESGPIVWLQVREPVFHPGHGRILKPKTIFPCPREGVKVFSLHCEIIPAPPVPRVPDDTRTLGELVEAGAQALLAQVRELEEQVVGDEVFGEVARAVAALAPPLAPVGPVVLDMAPVPLEPERPKAKPRKPARPPAGAAPVPKGTLRRHPAPGPAAAQKPAQRPRTTPSA